MVYVKKMPGDSDDSIIRKFSRKVVEEEIIPELRLRQFHAKPSLAKKLKRQARRNRRVMGLG